MEESKLYLFTTSTCTKCSQVKELFSSKNIDYIEMVVDKEDKAREIAIEYCMYSAPVLVIGDIDKANVENIIRDLDDITKYINEL